jgi:phage FluMu protein Com
MWQFLRNKIRTHQTVKCPHCGNDSWRFIFELPARCMWCNKMITPKQVDY